jgi:hypothetical protein
MHSSATTGTAGAPLTATQFVSDREVNDMAHASTVRSAESGATDARDLLFKPDRPREIDRYIDFFGGAHAQDEAEALLERPA